MGGWRHNVVSRATRPHRFLATLGMTRHTISSTDVDRVRERIARAHEIAAIQFRDSFVPGKTDPITHLQLLADALIGESDGIRLCGPAYEIRNGLIEPRYENFIVDRTPATIFEYWLIISEITGSDSWRMTKLITSPEEYDAALKRMRSPQIVRALVVTFLPRVEGNRLEVTVWTPACIERRHL
ncbi:MAG TPA: hypothetical protein VGR95_12800, partial [Thermoanaerobaculia bacterium]|nr:hypothetical protein [Thermoanaerobaculia bacterium]